MPFWGTNGRKIWKIRVWYGLTLFQEIYVWKRLYTYHIIPSCTIYLPYLYSFVVPTEHGMVPVKLLTKGITLTSCCWSIHLDWGRPALPKKTAQCSSNSYPRIDTPQNIWNKQIIITKDEGGNLKTAQLPIQRHLRLLFISQDHLLHREGAASIQIHAVAKQSELDHISFPLQFLLPHLAVTPRGKVKIHPVI